MQNTKVLNESSDNESSDSDVLAPSRKRLKRMIVDKSSEEEDTRQSWIWQKVKNTPIVWKYSETHGIKASVLNNLSKNPKILDLFSIIFDNKLGNTCYGNKSLRISDNARRADETWTTIGILLP